MTMRRLAATMAAAAIGLAMAGPALAFTQTWDLLDHPDGNQNPPPYGLRLDNLLNYDDFSWSFSSLGDMKLTYFSAAEAGGERIEMRGTATGGRYHSPNFTDMLDANGDRVWSDKATWSFDLTYNTSKDANGDPISMLTDFDGDPTTTELRVDNVVNLLGSSTTPGPNGRVELIGDLMQFNDSTNVYSAGSSILQVGDFVELNSRGHTNGNHFSFSKDRHRLGPNQGGALGPGNSDADCQAAGFTAEMCNRWTGFGWQTITASQIGGVWDPHRNSGTRDLLFTARLTESQTVPTPATFALLAVGLAGPGALRRRRAATA